MKNTIIALVLLGLAACASRASIDERYAGAGVLVSWKLVADQSLALRDQSRLAVAYPNPLECDSMIVRINAGGELCGRCNASGVEQEACGGPAVGIPYTLMAMSHDRKLDLAIKDIFGTTVKLVWNAADVCVNGLRPDGMVCSICSGADGAIVHDDCGADGQASTAPDSVAAPPEGGSCSDIALEGGLVCSICLDASGAVASNSCAGAPVADPGSSDSGAPPTDGDQAAPPAAGDSDATPGTGPTPPCTQVDLADGSRCEICYSSEQNALTRICQPAPGTGTDTGTGTGTDTGTESPATDNNTLCYLAGVDLFISKLNAELAAMGLPDSGLTVDEIPDAHVGSYNEFCGRGVSGNYSEGNGWLRDGDLRCAAIGIHVSTEACAAPPENCTDQDSVAHRWFANGLYHAYNIWTQAAFNRDGSNGWYGYDWDGGAPEDEFADVNPDLPECTGSPLVLDTGSGLQLVAAEHGVVFDLMGSGPLQVGWVAAGALLALDLDGNGQIDSGAELLGEGSRMLLGGPASDGFAALAQYDQPELGGNDDRRIDDSDLIFALLTVWRDDNHDGISQPLELVPIDQAGVRALSLESWAADVPAAQAAGNDVRLQGEFEWANGAAGSLYDVWFSVAAPPLPEA